MILAVRPAMDDVVGPTVRPVLGILVEAGVITHVAMTDDVMWYARHGCWAVQLPPDAVFLLPVVEFR